ncbi:glycosyltransferase family 9 protein [Kozakia baliensis]|uniref:glycosyltransferase family 9 protein n=1 Tax=Kozakia baliensis TaxID=153496 RepID=UPI00345B72CD
MFRILVIKLGALGDFVQAFAPFAAIRAAHPQAEIVLLTTAPFRDLAEASPWFDRVMVDEKPGWLDVPGLLRLRRAMTGFDLVIDLQTSGRSSRYFRVAGKPRWSGIARDCLFPHDNPHRNDMHTFARQRDQLRRAGIAPVDDWNLDWLARGGPVLEEPYAVLVPGAAPHRPAKRWPVARFAELAQWLEARGLRPVIVGSGADRELAAAIARDAPGAVDLTGKTDLLALAAVLARASLAVGNDTGPMHLAAALGCRAVVLFSQESDPRLTAPIGCSPGQVSVLAVPDLAKLQTDRVAALLE